jgi:hypothetical protein
VADSLSSVRDGPDAAYAAQAVLDNGTLAAIREANESFLVLLGSSAAEPGGPAALGLPVHVAARVGELGSAERARVADCPYTLFNLRFDDPQFWRSLLPERVTAAEPPARLDFARTAVFLAWHLAHSNALAAALVLGMSGEVQRAWRAIPLSVLDAASHIVLPHLSARWGSHPTFWARLLAGAGAAGPGTAESVRLLGLQLLAADGAWPAATAAAAAGSGTG